MRTKILRHATFIVAVKSYKGSDRIVTESLYCSDIEKYMPREYIRDRGIETFLNLDDLKETLNWNLNGYCNKYQFTWGMTSGGVTEGKAYVFCDYNSRTIKYLKALCEFYKTNPAATKKQIFELEQSIMAQ